MREIYFYICILLTVLLGIALMKKKISIENYFGVTLLFLTCQVMGIFFIDLLFNATRKAGQFESLIYVLRNWKIQIVYVLFLIAWFIRERKMLAEKKHISVHLTRKTKICLLAAVIMGIPLWLDRICLFIAAELSERSIAMSDATNREQILKLVIVINELIPMIRFVFYTGCFLMLLFLGFSLLAKKIKRQDYFKFSFLFICIEVMGLFLLEVLFNRHSVWGVIVVVENLFLLKHITFPYILFPLVSLIKFPKNKDTRKMEEMY